MISIKADWDEDQKRILLSRLRAVNNLVRYYMVAPKQLPRQLSIGYVTALRETIKAIPFYYAPYNPKYAEWKAAHGKHSGYWRLMGDLYASIKSFKFADGWYGGIKYGTMSSGTQSYGKGIKPKPIVMYGRVMEKGMKKSKNRSGVHPARPLFEPVFKQFTYSKSKSTRGNAWTIADAALMKVGNKWRGV